MTEAGNLDPATFAAFVARGHSPVTYEGENGPVASAVWYADDAGPDAIPRHGPQCAACGYMHDSAHADDTIPACDGAAGRARRLRRRARLAKARWERADAAAMRAEVAADVPRAHAYPDDRRAVDDVMRRFGIAYSNEARDWPLDRVLYLVLEILRTVPEHRVPAVDQAMRLSPRSAPRRADAVAGPAVVAYAVAPMPSRGRPVKAASDQ